MIFSPNYLRLLTFMAAARNNRGLDAWEKDHQTTLDGFDDAIARLTSFRDGHGFTGEAATAMNAWVDSSISRIQAYKASYENGYNAYDTGRQVMQAALAEAETLSPNLLDEKTAAMHDDWFVVVPDSEPGGGFTGLGQRFTSGEAYVEAVEAQANAQREAAAQRILDELNARTSSINKDMKDGTALDEALASGNKQDDKHGSDSTGGGATGLPWSRSAADGYGRGTGRDSSSGEYPGGFDQPWWSEADAAAAHNRIISSGAVPTQEPAYGEPGSRTNPITDPQDLMDTDLLHTRVNGTTYRNGIIGGHTPAPAADAHHPLWRLNSGPASDASSAGRMGGAGVLGAGALGLRGAARLGAPGVGGAGAGASALRTGSYSGSGFGSYTPPAATSTAGVTGTPGAIGAPGASEAGGAVAGTPGRGAPAGGFMGGAGAGAGAAGKGDKKSRKRKYVPFVVIDDEDDARAGYVNPLSQTYGSDQDLVSVRRVDDGWDERQW